MYKLQGRKVVDRSVPSHVMENNEGYLHSDSVFYDGGLETTLGHPHTLFISTFKPDIEAKFRFTLYFKHS